ncbi:uncharacterized protein METZ01_LOCUS149322 [marine metagenome]|uniref:Uncharacterized protein n=1 Tax=marine metagenome TaxID=408172 RepID=A0A382A4K8_9ZZZZ
MNTPPAKLSDRLGQPQDAANAVYLLRIPESDCITGEVAVASGVLIM